MQAYWKDRHIELKHSCTCPLHNSVEITISSVMMNDCCDVVDVNFHLDEQLFRSLDHSTVKKEAT